MQNLLAFVIFLFSTFLVPLIAQNKIGLIYNTGYSNLINHSSFKERYVKSKYQSIFLQSAFLIFKNSYIIGGIGFEGREFSVIGRYYEILGVYPNYFLGSEVINRNRFNEMGYISLPIIFQHEIKMEKRTYLQIGFGGYFSYLINQNWSYKYDGGRFQYDNVGPLSPIDNPYNDKYNKVDGGFIIKFGLRYKINNFFSATISGKWARGFLNIIDSKEVSAYNINKAIGICIEYKIN